MSTLFTPYKLGPVTLRNRTIRSAAFESMGKDFGPTEQLKQYHVSVARGGIGMTTLAYAAVSRSGLSFNKQLWLRPAIAPALRDITDAIHKEGAAASIQIGHCGNMTHYSTAGQIPIGASSGFNLYAYTPVRKMRRDDLRAQPKLALEREPAAADGSVGQRGHADTAPGDAHVVVLELLRGAEVFAHRFEGCRTDGAVAERNLPQTIGREEYGILQITHNWKLNR